MHEITMLHNITSIPAASNIITVTWSRLLTVTPLVSEDESIITLKYSFPSNKLSSVTEIWIKALVSPAANVTEYGPEP